MGAHQRTAIVMSRLPRLIDPQSMWLGGLRAALRSVHQREEMVLIADGIAGSHFVCRGAERLGIPIEVLDTSIDAETPPDRDQIIILAADSVVALGVRANGNVHRCLQQRLTNDGVVELADLSGLQPQSVRDDLIARGATLWSPSSSDLVPFSNNEPAKQLPASIYEVVPFPTGNDWVYLSHTTRACPGPWPGETVELYVDSLLDNADSADHSPAAALQRILRERRLVASNRTIRGGHAVVCFTAVPLLDLPKLRQFRTHRGRWDFEPFGLCIRRDWLMQRGARPVIYGDESVWAKLPDEDRPFFQLARNDSIDWSVEREWRHRGDLDLFDLPPDQALVFVPTAETASRLSALSPWPLTLWPND